ncbi:MFS transporter [Dactylosporangium sp. NPDC005572]|uniref:MFS transporter n=1 Tax=Dactylosporangium sp. NPDC005572 TaxID=3156889 RepID=UPI0033B7A1B6
MYAEVDAFAGRAPVRVRVGAAAPLGWWAAVCVALVACIDRVEANLLAGALSQVQEEFGFGDAAAGAIPTASAVAGILLLIPAGRLADTGRRGRIIAGVVAVWAVLTLGSGLATGYAMLFALRVALGGAGQLYNPPASSLLADYFPPGSRARAFGLERAGYFTGLPIGVLAGGALAEAFGWRLAFVLIAVPGLVVALLCLTIREPVRGIGDHIGRLQQRTAPAVHQEIEPDATPVPQQIRQLLRIRTLRVVVAGLTIMFFGLGGLYFWMPSFYQRRYDLDEAAAAAVTGGVGLVGIVLGMLLGSRLGDRYHGRRPGWRLTLGGTALFVGTAGLAGSLLMPALAAQSALYLVANAGFSAAIPNLTAANADIVPAHRRGMGFAVLQLVVTLGGAAGPWLIGLASDATGSLTEAFAVLLVPLGIGAWVIVRGRRHFDADVQAATTAAPPVPR